MTSQALHEMLARWSYEIEQAHHHGGKAITALLRLILVTGMLIFLDSARFLGLLDDQLQAKQPAQNPNETATQAEEGLMPYAR